MLACRVAELEEQIKKLRGFSEWVLGKATFYGQDIDGGSIQEKGEQFGLMVLEDCTEDNRELWEDSEYAYEGGQIYRFTPTLTGEHAAACAAPQNDNAPAADERQAG